MLTYSKSPYPAHLSTFTYNASHQCDWTDPRCTRHTFKQGERQCRGCGRKATFWRAAAGTDEGVGT